jgi:hypothetical protein
VAGPSLDDLVNSVAGAKATSAPPTTTPPPAPTRSAPNVDDLLNSVAGAKAAPAPPQAEAPAAPDAGGVVTPATPSPPAKPFQQPRDVARKVTPSTGPSAGDVWKTFVEGIKQVPKAGGEAAQAEVAAEQKAGLPAALSYVTEPFQFGVAATSQAMGTVFDTAVKAALAFAGNAGMDETTQNQLEGDLNTLMLGSSGDVGALHGQIKAELEKRAPPGTAEAFDKASMPPTDRGPGITVHHGSPHQFQQFDTAKVGTGEGNQSYGHGLYFAENPDVANTYRKNAPVSPETAAMASKYPPTPEGGEALATRARELSDKAQAGTLTDAERQELGQIKQYHAYLTAPEGHLYTSTIHGTPDEFLHLDKPVSEQSAHVQEALKKSPEAQAAIKRLGGDPTGEQVYRAMAEDLGGGPDTPMEKLPEADARASAALNQAGIKGNRYLDAGSRGAGEGTHNYVVFNHDDVSITHVNGEHLADIVAKARGAAGGPPAGEPPFAGPPPGEPPGEPPPPTRASITATQTDLADRLHAHDQRATADNIETMQLGKPAHEAIPDTATREQLIHYQEQPNKITLSDRVKALFNKHVLPIIRAREEVQNKIADLEGKPRYPAWPNPRPGEDISHAPRMAKDKGSTIDWLLKGIGMRVGRKSLSKVGDKARTVKGPMIDNPRVAYHKDVVVNNLVKLAETKRQLRNMEMTEHLKSAPELDALREPKKPGGWGQTPGWRQIPHVPQLGDHFWHPRIANAIDDAFKDFKRSGDGAAFYAHVNRLLVGSMFYTPIGHILNVFTDTLISKGAVGMAVDLVTGRSFKAFGKAVREVATLGKDYRANLRAGSSLQYGAVATDRFIPSLVEGLDRHVKADPGAWAEIAKAAGHANPVELVKGIYNLSRKFLWGVGDVLKLTRQYELEAKGMSRAEAIKETEKHIVSYRVPTEVGSRVLGERGGRMLSQLMQSPVIFAFGRYHYGLLKSLASVGRDLAVGTAKERMRAVDSALMMGVVYLGYRVADDQVRKLLGNQDASIKRSGIFGLEDLVEKAAAGEKDARDVIQRIMTLNPAFSFLADLYEERDPYTGQKVVREQDLIEHPGRFAKEIGNVFGQKIMPIKEGIDLATGKTTPQQEILKQLNINDPDPDQVELARIARLKADRATERSMRKKYGD